MEVRDCKRIVNAPLLNHTNMSSRNCQTLRNLWRRCRQAAENRILAAKCSCSERGIELI